MSSQSLRTDATVLIRAFPTITPSAPVEADDAAVERIAVEPRIILAAALVHGAHGIVAAHNHPSGDPAPSAEDLFLTRRLTDACELVGLNLVDSLVLAHGHRRDRRDFRWVSLRRHALLQRDAA